MFHQGQTNKAEGCFALTTKQPLFPIKTSEKNAFIHGIDCLKDAKVVATDLRASAALLLAALSAKGVTEISQANHLWRGYYDLEERLVKLGARIRTTGYGVAERTPEFIERAIQRANIFL